MTLTSRASQAGRLQRDERQQRRFDVLRGHLGPPVVSDTAARGVRNENCTGLAQIMGQL